jgi:NADP-dependent 3-hydroxy acid dehydrogenase YdfG
MSSEAPRVVYVYPGHAVHLKTLLTMLSRLLTGAGGGIGLAIAENLLSNGARVVGVDLSTARLSDLKARYDAQLEIVTGDVGERSTSAQAVEIATTKFGRLDSIILNAAILAPVGPAADTDVEGWRKLFDVNFFALLHTVRHSSILLF